MSKEQERWFPQLVDDAYLARLRKDYPENAHLDDDALRSEYGCESKYGVTWDHIGDAYDEYEPLADAYLELRDELSALKEENAKLRKALEFYGDNKNWTDYQTVSRHPGDSVGMIVTTIEIDNGQRARNALKDSP